MNQELKAKIKELLSTNNRGLYIDEIIAEIDDNYKVYTPKEFDDTIFKMEENGELEITDQLVYLIQ